MTRRFLLAIRGQVLRLDYPRRTPAQLAPFDDVAPNHAQRRHDAHIHDSRCRLKSYLAPLAPLALAIDGNAVVAAERAYARLGPAIATPGSRPAGGTAKEVGAPENQHASSSKIPTLPISTTLRPASASHPAFPTTS